MLVETKKNYNDKELRNSKNKSKTIWQIVNREIGRNQEFVHNVDNPKNLANEFNKYFTTIASELITNSNCDYSCDIEQNPYTFCFAPISPSDLKEYIYKIKNTNSYGIDEIPLKIITQSFSSICEPLCDIINASLSTGSFPSAMKHAIINPVHKRGDTSSVGNFRPISLLTTFSKILEMVVFHQLLSFFKKHNLFNKNQHGFLAGKSTVTALFEFTEMVLSMFEEGNMICGLFLDLTKAFDCMSHSILLDKLYHYGIRGIAHDWFGSYLDGRQQTVRLNSSQGLIYSDSMTINIGVPQGSVLGPLLFLIFINDIFTTSTDAGQKIINFADDTNLLFSGETLASLMSSGESLLNDVEIWFQNNQLLLNSSKTNCIFFKLNESTETPQISIMNDSVTNITKNCKVLGIIIDDKFRWTEHISYVCKRLSSACYALRILRSITSFSTLKTVYHAYVVSILRYGLVVWGNSNEISRVFVLQKRALRTLLGLKFRDSLRSLFRQNGLLTVYGLYIYECLIFISRNKHLFKEHEKMHNYATRKKLDFDYPIHKLTRKEKGISYMCMKFFNKLPEEIKSQANPLLFKKKVFRYICSLEPYTLNEYLEY